MGEIRKKTQLYVMIMSLVGSVLGLAIMISCQGRPARIGGNMTSAQKLRALEMVSPPSPAMARFLQREQSRQESDREVFGSSPQ